MSNRYGGESVGKKLARYTFWDRTKRWLGDRFFTEKHLVLASRDGGDIAEWRGALQHAHDQALKRGAFVSEYSDTLYAEEREDYEVTYLGHTAVIPIESSFDREFLTMRSLVAASRHLDETFPGQAHQLLNVAPGRLAAWRAHETRGTYAAGRR